MKLVFESNFNAPDNRWKTRHTPDPDLPAGDFCPCYTAAGRLQLRLQERDGVVHTSHLSVLDQPFTFGRFETRMKMMGPKGAHSCFWLQDVEPDYIGGSEVDVVENFGSDDTVWHNVYWRTEDTMWPKEPTRWRQAVKPIDRRSWHTYAVDWQADSYRFYIDDKLISTVTEGLSSRPKVMILSLLSSKWEWDKLQRDQLDKYRTMVDWVRVYQ